MDNLEQRLFDLGYGTGSKTPQEAINRIKELEGILQEVDAWIEDLGVYADPHYKPAPIFLKVREALSGKRNTED